MKRYFVFILSLICSLEASATDGNHYNYAPKSPEAAAFDRVPDIPVSSYTGALSLSIPIYTVTCGDIVLPISLDYQGTAIPVRQEATWVGLNWLLNAGGAVITRIGGNSLYDGGVYYKEDWENLSKRLSFRQFHIDGGEFLKFAYKDNGQHPNWCGDYGKNWFQCIIRETGPERNEHNDLAFNLYNDIFKYQTGETPTYHASFFGNSVTFIWDKTKKEFMITGRKQNFRIEGTPTSITITDGKGIKYCFFTVEQARLDGSDVDSGHTPQDLTLYLSSVKSPSGHIVTFQYMDGGLIKPVYNVSETLYDNKFPDNLEDYTGLMKYELKSNALLTRRLSHYYIIQSKRLSSITTDTGLKIKFNASPTPRLDLNGESYSLNNIEVCRQVQGKETVLKRYRFSYSYFSKNTVGGNTVYDLFNDMNNLSLYKSWFTSEDFMYKRLRLDSFWEENVNSNSSHINKYKFAYNDDLPCKASSAVDYWGYYNGQNNMRGSYHSMLAKCWDERSEDATYDIPTYMKSELYADRRFSLSHAVAGMLTSITYPTGGTAHIAYEANSFTNMVYFDTKTKTTKKPFGPVQVYRSNQANYSQGSSACEGDSTYEIKYPGKYKVYVSFYKNNMQHKAYWRNLLPFPILVYQLETATGPAGQYDHTTGCQVLTLGGHDTLSTYNVTFEQIVVMKKGKCKLMIGGDMQKSLDNGAFYQITASMSKVKEPFESKGAGVRVKEITETDGEGTSTTTSYSYINSDDTSSGTLMAPLIFAREKMLLHQTNISQEVNGVISPIPPPKEIKYWKVSNECLSPNPAIVGYGRVVVKRSGGSDKNGEHVYTYWNKRWGTADIMNFYKRIEDPRNGLVLADSVFDNSHKLVQVKENSYKWQCSDSRLLSVVIDNIYHGPNQIIGNANPYRDVLRSGCMQIYMYPSVQFSMLSSRSVTKDLNGGTWIEACRNVVYNQTNGQDSIVNQRMSESNDNTIQEIYYPIDVLTNSDNKALADAHINENPIEQLTSIKNDEGTYVSSDVRYEYNSIGCVTNEYLYNSSSCPLRSNFSTLKNSYSFSSFDKTAVLSYNSAYKPRTVQENGGEIVTYLWGYNSQYPIAVVRNSNFAKIAATLGGESQVNSMEQAIQPTRTSTELYNILSKIQGGLVSIYSFNPYIGIIEMIAANGEKTTYSYDDFCRLESIKDHDGIVSRAYKYNYRQ